METVKSPPDAEKWQLRPIEFSYDANFQGHVAWLNERISETEIRKTRIAACKDGYEDVVVIGKLKSWGVRVSLCPSNSGAYFLLHDTPLVRRAIMGLNWGSAPKVELAPLLANASNWGKTDLTELKDHIWKNGLLNPITVLYGNIIHGRRRALAMYELGYTEIPVER